MKPFVCAVIIVGSSLAMWLHSAGLLAPWLNAHLGAP